MIAAHTFKVGDKVMADGFGLCVVAGMSTFWLWLFDVHGDPRTVARHLCTLYIPPPVEDTWTLKTVRRAPKEGDFYLGNERVFVIEATQDHTHEADVIVAVTRQDGDQ